VKQKLLFDYIYQMKKQGINDLARSMTFILYLMVPGWLTG
jgi:hypothetical protein